MAERNGLDHQPVDTLFGEERFDAGIIRGLGHVFVCEARLADIWPYMGEASTASEFGMRMLAASVEINGKRFTYEDFGKISVRHLNALQKLFPHVQRINNIGGSDEPEEAPKNVEGAVVTAPEGSAAATGS
jgi:hypothetical protein